MAFLWLSQIGILCIAARAAAPLRFQSRENRSVNMRTRSLSVVAALGFLFAASPASALVNIITNGSFEFGTNDAAFGSFQTIPGSGASINNWTVNGSVDWINGYWQAQQGTHSVDLNGLSQGGVQQSIATTIGQAYALTFYMSGNPDNGPGVKTLIATAGDASASFSYPVTSATTREAMNWVPQTLNFTATGTSTVINFASATNGNCCWGPALDNVAVSAIPELSTWMMMLIGFAGVGFVAYRRSRRQSPIAA
jgi:choice-of-anchor C domain-containing protein